MSSRKSDVTWVGTGRVVHSAYLPPTACSVPQSCGWEGQEPSTGVTLMTAGSGAGEGRTEIVVDGRLTAGETNWSA